MSEITKCPVCFGSKVENGMGGMRKACTHCKAVGYINPVVDVPASSDELKLLQEDNEQLKKDRLLLLKTCEELQGEIDALNKKLLKTKANPKAK